MGVCLGGLNGPFGCALVTFWSLFFKDIISLPPGYWSFSHSLNLQFLKDYFQKPIRFSFSTGLTFYVRNEIRLPVQMPRSACPSLTWPQHVFEITPENQNIFDSNPSPIVTGNVSVFLEVKFINLKSILKESLTWKYKAAPYFRSKTNLSLS